MRDITFRGKRIDNGEWVYGYYFVMVDAENNPVKHCVVKNMSSVYTETGFVKQDYFQIDPKTLGQYVGLCDKNGTKIFEGDIVRIGSQIGCIVYNYGSFGIGLSEVIDYKNLEKKTVFWLGIENDNFLPLLEVYWNFNDEDEVLSEVEVIGNTHDNPKLIQGDNNYE